MRRLLALALAVASAAAYAQLPAPPRGLARVIVPMKLYVGRPRGNGRFYQPDIALRTVGWGSAELLKLIESQAK